MVSNKQIKLLQTAVRAAGLRDRGQYYLLLRQYKQPNGSPCESCKQLNSSQIDDVLAICESYGWRMPGKSEDYYRKRIAEQYGIASFAQQSAIKKLADDLGWDDRQVNGMVGRMSKGQAANVSQMKPREAHALIEALKVMFGRKTGRHYVNLTDVQQDMENATDGKENDTSQN